MRKLSTLLLILVFLISLTPILNAQGAWKVKIERDALNRIQYVGQARPGTAISTSTWQIKRITYVGVTTDIDSIDYAGGDSSYKWRWDLRTGYPYS